MENIVFYFSGTGNSLKVARTLAKELGNCEIVSMAKAEKYSLTKQYDTIGFVYPVYYWGLPKKVIEFVKNTNYNNAAAYYYSVATYGGIIGNGVRQLNELLNERGVTLNYGEKIRMVGNYIIGYDVFVNINKCLRRADKKLLSIIANIKNRESRSIKKPYKIIERNHKEAMQKISLLAKDYNVNENCIGCGVCKEVCPVKNIEMLNKKPVFKDHCEQCVACIQHCPKEAINYKNITQKRKRYTHPEISYKELSEYNDSIV
jgi:ferredoxin/flavodoxin